MGDDIFGDNFELFAKHLKQAAIRTQVAIVLGSSQQEYFKALMAEGLTEDQAFKIMDMTFRSFMIGVAEFMKAVVPPRLLEDG